ncbi:MAG TPA: hypothetical protein VEC12_14995 [Bacteroidia bacterium]|nr:hypothetical protein [Bacteroidia bacterium]
MKVLILISLLFPLKNFAQSDSAVENEMFVAKFEYNSDSLTPKCKERLLSLMPGIKKLMDSCRIMYFIPHSCREEIELDEMIAYKRANTLIKIFISYNIEPRKINIKTYQECPRPGCICHCYNEPPFISFVLEYCQTG